MPFEFLVGCLVCFTLELCLKWNEVSESVSMNNAVFQAVFFVVVKISIDVTLALFHGSEFCYRNSDGLGN